MKRQKIYFLFFLSFIFSSCKRDFSVSDTYDIQLIVESAEVVEAWLSLKVTPIDTEAIYTVKRDTHIIFNGKLEKVDTLLHDVNLQPAQNYFYRVFRNNEAEKTSIIEINTMDTTSHNFEWQVFEFGDNSSSYFSDVFIVNENEIWAVGKVYTDSGDFNAAHWNGYNWKLKRFITSNFVVFPIRGLYVFSNDNIWFAAGSIYHWDGNNTKLSYLRDINSNEMVESLWASSENKIYGVGQSGIIVQYNGQTWQKLNSGTDVDINDIWSSYDEQTGEDYILCPASYKYKLGEKKLLKINSDFSVTDEIWPFSDRRIHSVWFRNNHKIMICGAGVFTRNRLGIWEEYSELPLIYTNRIRGNDINDIFVAGDFGLLAHFNGLNWFIYKNPTVDLFQSLDFKNNLAINVGRRGKKAVILMMCR